MLWEKKFQKKCEDCMEEYQHAVDQCNLCGGQLRNPDPDEVVYPKWLFNERNTMDQRLMDVLQAFAVALSMQWVLGWC